MRLLIVLALCFASAFAGAYYSHKHSAEWNSIRQKTKDLKQEMENKVGLLGEQTESLHAKLKRCLNEKYECCKN